MQAFLRIRSHLLKKSLMENFILCAMFVVLHVIGFYVTYCLITLYLLRLFIFKIVVILFVGSIVVKRVAIEFFFSLFTLK